MCTIHTSVFKVDSFTPISTEWIQMQRLRIEYETTVTVTWVTVTIHSTLSAHTHTHIHKWLQTENLNALNELYG